MYEGAKTGKAGLELIAAAEFMAQYEKAMQRENTALLGVLEIVHSEGR